MVDDDCLRERGSQPMEDFRADWAQCLHDRNQVPVAETPPIVEKSRTLARCSRLIPSREPPDDAG